MYIKDDFHGSVDPYWTQVNTGAGRIEIEKSRMRLGFESAQKNRYTDAQIDDYTMLPRSEYVWQPPLRMVVRARFSLPAATANSTLADNDVLKGTAGFGFWNNPFSLTGKVKVLPEAVWFFYSAPPANTALVPDVVGWGWKAQSIHMMRPSFAAYLAPVLTAVAYGKLTGNNKPAAHSIQRMAAASEVPISQDIRKWHTYTLEWGKTETLFWVDGELLLRAKQAPRRPLGFVIWLDNQYAIATPEGVFRFGKVDTGPQWMEVDSISIESLR